ncbi:ketoacyl-ACP synthase III [Bacteroides fluxus]|uniref:ketoacyl-ACP synthase III n=1 Tax=Bacteroides fluxus TaxID=626930 RepID=UPI002357B8BC|nr:ketoacyl-ACP synthase III [Bacteroides fluxus]
MSQLTIGNIKIAGMAACVPAQVEENLSLAIFKDEGEAKKVIASTGIERRRVVRQGTTASDLTVAAVRRMLDDLGWKASEVDCMFYVCTSRDFIAPQTACILQDRLGLRNDCFVMDLPLGCSGWIYGMSVISSLMSHGTLKKGLLVAAETNSLNRSSKDRTVKPLFGDASTVTALEYDTSCLRPFNFVFGVDGSGYQAVWTKYGGMRHPATIDAVEEKEVEPGIVRKGTDMVVNGMDVFAFAIKTPPRSLKELIEQFRIDVDEVDWLYLHQANKFIDEKIRKSVKMPAGKVPYCLEEFGNVTSASIPLAMVTRTAEALRVKENHCLACGFGVGLAWASMEFSVGNIVVSELVEYKD